MVMIGVPDSAVNVLGGALETCSNAPLTGFFRDGCCNTSDQDAGCHTVCAVMTRAFLDFSRSRGTSKEGPIVMIAHPGGVALFLGFSFLNLWDVVEILGSLLGKMSVKILK